MSKGSEDKKVFYKTRRYRLKKLLNDNRVFLSRQFNLEVANSINLLLESSVDLYERTVGKVVPAKIRYE